MLLGIYIPFEENSRLMRKIKELSRNVGQSLSKWHTLIQELQMFENLLNEEDYKHFRRQTLKEK